MKAIYAEEPFKIGMRDIEIPAYGDDEVLLKVIYAGVCSSDLHAYRGVHAFRKPPVMLGHEMSGIIVEKGKNVTDFEIGEAVTVMPQIGCGKCEACKKGFINLCTSKKLPAMNGWGGTFGEYFNAPASILCRLDGVPFDLGSVVEPLAVATHVINRVPKDHNEDLVILGSGAIALMILILSKEYGFKRVMMTDIDDRNLELARSLGAAKTVNVSRENAAEAAREFFGGDGAQNVIIGAGGPNILAESFDIAATGGNIIYYAMITKDMTLNTYPIVFKELNLYGSMNYTMKDFDKAVASLKTNGDTFRKIITHRFELEDAALAFEMQDKKEEFVVKSILHVAD